MGECAFDQKPCLAEGLYYKHFGSVAPTARCFSWPLAVSKSSTNFPLPAHRDLAGIQATSLNNLRLYASAAAQQFIVQLPFCYIKPGCPTCNALILLRTPPGFCSSAPKPAE